MITGRRASDWLAAPSAEQSGDDRRAGDRRSPRRPLDPLFAATLVNQVAPAESVYAHYPQARPLVRPGAVVNLRA